MTGTRAEIEAKLTAEGYSHITFALYDDAPDERIGWAKTYIVQGRYTGQHEAEKSGMVYPLGFSDSDQ